MLWYLLLIPKSCSFTIKLQSVDQPNWLNFTGRYTPLKIQGQDGLSYNLCYFTWAACGRWHWKSLCTAVLSAGTWETIRYRHPQGWVTIVAFGAGKLIEILSALWTVMSLRAWEYFVRCGILWAVIPGLTLGTVCSSCHIAVGPCFTCQGRGRPEGTVVRNRTRCPLWGLCTYNNRWWCVIVSVQRKM